jgi:hypothetical protein
MSSPTDTDRPAEAVTVAQQYLGRERPLSALLVVVVVSLFTGTYVRTSLLPAVLVGVVLLVALRAPVLRPHGSVRLRSDNSPQAVQSVFEGPTPPVLALQWGVADTVTIENEAAVYSTSYLFGLRSVETTVRTEAETTANGDTRVEMDITMGGQPWATYTATSTADADGTVVEVEYDSNRRFGLRRVPQQILAHRYRDDALNAQGYVVVERESYLR